MLSKFTFVIQKCTKTSQTLKIFDKIKYKVFLFLGRYFLYFIRIPFKDNEIKM